MSKIDLKTFTDKELLELQKQILEEKKVRKEFGKPLFKSDLRFNQDDYDLLLNKIEDHVKKQIPDKVGSDVHLPECYCYVNRIREYLIEICDLVFGNFKVSVSNEKKRVRIARGTARLIIDNVDEYEQLYLELLEAIEKRCKEEEKLPKKVPHMTYGEIYDNCIYTMAHVPIVDYRPNDPMYTKDLEDKNGIVVEDKAGIVVWFKNDDTMIYYPKIEEEKHEEA